MAARRCTSLGDRRADLRIWIFLVAKDIDNLDRLVAHAAQMTEEKFWADDPEFVVEIKNKTKNIDRMITYELKVSHPAFIGKTMVKVEFWRVDAQYLIQYPVELRAPHASGRKRIAGRQSRSGGLAGECLLRQADSFCDSALFEVARHL